MLKKSITLFASLMLFVVIGASSSKAQEVNLGGFTGNVSTIVTHGFSVRTEKNNCFLVSGSPTTPAVHWCSDWLHSTQWKRWM